MESQNANEMQIDKDGSHAHGSLSHMKFGLCSSVRGIYTSQITRSGIF